MPETPGTIVEFRHASFQIGGAKILDNLNEYDALRNPPLGETGRSALGWVEGELTVSTVKLRKDQKSHSDHKPDRPAAYGPSVEVVLEPKTDERLSLFAVRPGSFAVQHVLLFHADNARAAYWQIGDVAYALVSESRKADDLAETARDLSRTLY